MTVRFRTNAAKRRMVAGLLAACAALTGCDGAVSPGAVASAPASAAPPPGSAPVVVASSGTPAASDPPMDFIEPLPAAVRAAMTGASWRPGCPVALDDLRLVHVSYVDFDGAVRPGRLVVHRAIAEATLRVFRRLRELRYPIRGMRLVDDYGGSDDASMAADNTSAFNCRNVPGTGHWSNHAYGRAIDVNTVENPYLPGDRVMPPAGRSYLDRRDVRPGMISAGDATVKAFAAEGFAWGGAWRNGTDYQHFEKTA